uniref:Uncharacterized protein n=1 Tax=Arundo donax TaxID=35708 RepID=A0A0A9EGT8_ARUDO
MVLRFRGRVFLSVHAKSTHENSEIAILWDKF